MGKLPFEGKDLVGKFEPVVDRQFNVVAYDAQVDFVEPGSKADFSFQGLDLRVVLSNLDYYYKVQALKNYKETVPLILSASNLDLFPESLPRPEGIEIILMLRRNMKLDSVRVNQLSDEGFQFALEETLQGLIFGPLLQFTQPKFIKLSFEELSVISHSKTPLYKKDWQFIATDIESLEDFECVQSIANSFMGSWISEQVEASCV